MSLDSAIFITVALVYGGFNVAMGNLSFRIRPWEMDPWEVSPWDVPRSGTKSQLL
ncbi:hypothetical protein BDA99DRAFT_557025 [Phascolomyces articulosus]|uniref:Uncharacterized protein n=1 Tax=Phascolomyces articulosus TaxID=60185 RepID=A0AAD5K6R5_9FUNG|nr:hypothetical protein BDA99DRAFT_557025 [Phascolomyces articulosus]